MGTQFGDKIKFATYGYGQYNTGWGPCMQIAEQRVDVTARLVYLLNNFGTPGYPATMTVNLSNLGLTTDPALGMSKSLTVFYTDGTPADDVPENSVITIPPFNPAGVPPTANCTTARGVLSAWWGVPAGRGGNGSQQVDVTLEVFDHGLYSISLRPLQTFFTARLVADPAPNQTKILLVHWNNCFVQGSGMSGPQTEGWPYTLPNHLFIQ